MRSYTIGGIVAVAALCVGVVASSSDTKVTYIPAEQVSAAFAKGAVLVNHGSYQVHASRRDAEGQVEIHGKDADLIYMLSGTTTFVTGGTIVGGQTTAPDEIRGTGLQGGEARRLTRGDVIIVPKGTPHWFKEVSGPVQYYVVKVR